MSHLLKHSLLETKRQLSKCVMAKEEAAAAAAALSFMAAKAEIMEKKTKRNYTAPAVLANVAAKFQQEWLRDPKANLWQFAIANEVKPKSLDRVWQKLKKSTTIPTRNAATTIPTRNAATTIPTTPAIPTAAAINPIVDIEQQCTCRNCPKCLSKLNQTVNARFFTATANLMHHLKCGAACSIPRPDPVEIDMKDAVKHCSSKFWNPQVDVTTLKGFDAALAQKPKIRASFARLQSRCKDSKTISTVNAGIAEHDYRMEPGRVFKRSGDGSMVFGYWDVLATGGVDEWGYAALDSDLPVSNSAAVAISRDYSRLMLQNPTYRRVGNGGAVREIHSIEDDHLNPGSVSVGTQKGRKWHLPPNGTAPNPVLKWTNKDGEESSRAPVSDIPGFEIKSNKVRARLKTGANPLPKKFHTADEVPPVDFARFLREYTIAIQQSRLTTQMVVCYHKLPEEEGFPIHLHNNQPKSVWAHFNSTTKLFCPATINATIKEWTDIDPSLSEWEIFLLEYSLMTGEIANDAPLAAHLDKSKGHLIETMFYVAKIDPNDPRNNTDLAESCEQMIGQTMMPFQGAAWQLRPTRDVLHANFQHTTHVADSDRGHTNISVAKHSRAKK